MEKGHIFIGEKEMTARGVANNYMGKNARNEAIEFPNQLTYLRSIQEVASRISTHRFCFHPKESANIAACHV